MKSTTKGKRMEPYKARSCTNDVRNIQTESTTVKEVDGESYVVLDSGNYLFKDWMGIFQWFQGGKASHECLT